MDEQAAPSIQERPRQKRPAAQDRGKVARSAGLHARFTVILVLALLVALGGGLPATAGATFPGRNGLFVAIGDPTPASAAAPGAHASDCGGANYLSTFRPDGTHTRSLLGDRGLFSPDGRWLASDFSGDDCYFYGSGKFDPGRGLFLSRPDGSQRHRIPNTRRDDELVGWLPGGRLIAARSQRHRLRLFEPLKRLVLMTLDNRGLDEYLLNGYPLPPVAVSRSGRVAAVRHTRRGYQLELSTPTVVRAGGRVRVRVFMRRVLASRFPMDGLGWAPNGSAIVFWHQDRPGYPAPQSLWLVGADGERPHRVSSPGRATDHYAAWSPDGRRLVFLRTRYDRRGDQVWAQMIVINGDGSQPHVVARFGRPQFAFEAAQRGVWSPDASSLAVNRFDSIWIVSATTGVRRARIRGDFSKVWDWQALPGRRGVSFTG